MSMHIDAGVGDIADKVILVGDPDRAEYIADKFFESPLLVNRKRGALCYTGEYKERRLSVMSTGMGIPSMLIYATELYRDYGVDTLIRTGTSGGYLKDMHKYDIVLAEASCTTSSLNEGVFNGTFCPIADFTLLRTAYDVAEENNMKVYVGNTICNDRYYRNQGWFKADKWVQYGILCSEMEGAGLYTAAAEYGKKALMLVSVMSYLEIVDGREVPHRLEDEEGSRGMDNMILLALETAIRV